MENNAYQVLLYYKYVSIEEPELFAQTHLDACKEIGLLGRILVSPRRHKRYGFRDARANSSLYGHDESR